MDKNEVYVTTDLNDETLWRKDVELVAAHWINSMPQPGTYSIRIRHRAPLVSAELMVVDGKPILRLDEAQRAITPGQSVVMYHDDICLGGGIVL